MFNAEKLLGQVIGGVLGSKGHGKKKKNDLLGGLTSGAGLMTAIGLAVGAYEVLKDKKTAPPSPPGYATGPAMPPPPPPVGQVVGSIPASPPVPAPAAAPAVPSGMAPVSGELSTEELARRMIQVMVAAACADGTMDEQEEKAILDRLRRAELSQEERMFMLEELHHPKDIASLTAGISNSSTAKAMYMLAIAAIAIDTEAERRWLDDLARGLGLSQAVQQFIEEQNETA